MPAFINPNKMGRSFLKIFGVLLAVLIIIVILLLYVMK